MEDSVAGRTEASSVLRYLRSNEMDWIGMVLMGVLHSGYIRVMRDRR